MILCDLHVHSDNSPDGRHSLEKLIVAAEKKGIGAIAVCDHNLCTPLPKSENILLIPGTEISTTAGHILGLFYENPIDYKKLTAKGLPTGKEAIDEIHSCGGIAVLAHPFERRDADKNTLLSLDVDLIESANGRADMRVRNANALASLLAEEMRKPVVGGSDAHCTGEVGNAVTEVNTDVISLDAIKEMLLLGKCQSLLNKQCSEKQKRMSQWVKAVRRKNPVKMVKPLCALILSPIFDLAKGNKQCH